MRPLINLKKEDMKRARHIPRLKTLPICDRSPADGDTISIEVEAYSAAF